jgi:hypothetical protein
MDHLRSACGASNVLAAGDTSGPAKRLRFSVGSYRASDVTPELKPAPRRALGDPGFMCCGCRFGAMEN